MKINIDDVSSKIDKGIEDIISGKLKVGDEVYCTDRTHYVIILELPTQDEIELYLKERQKQNHVPFTGEIKYKTKGRGKIGYTSVSTIVKPRNKKIGITFQIKIDNYKNSKFSDVIWESKNQGMLVKRKIDSDFYHFEILSDSQESLNDLLHNFYDILENKEWHKY